MFTIEMWLWRRIIIMNVKRTNNKTNEETLKTVEEKSILILTTRGQKNLVYRHVLRRDSLLLTI